MDTDQHTTVSVNGKPDNQHTPRQNPQRRVNLNLTYGIALIFVMLFKFVMTWLLGLTPDPLLVNVNIGVGCVGGALLLLGCWEIRTDSELT